MNIELSRRAFFKLTGITASGLVLAASPMRLLAGDKAEAFQPNAFVLIEPDNQITLWAPRPEMGQGTKTGLATVLAEELDIDVGTVKMRHATTESRFGYIGVGGSWGLQGRYKAMREAGATARMMLIAAAAKVWSLPPAACRVERGRVVNNTNNRQLSFGELASLAATLPVPEQVELKPVSRFRQVGTNVKRVDNADLVQGKTTFGLDVKMPGMVYATIERCPHPDGRLRAVEDSAARKVRGVLDVVKVTGTGFPHATPVRDGVAVIAEHHWATKQGRAALNIDWQPGKDARLTSRQLRADFSDNLDQGKQAFARGNSEAAFAAADSQMSATYTLPFVAHTAMETPNATAVVSEQGCEIWCGIQSASKLQAALAPMLGLDKEAIIIHPLLCGGSFGRRLEVEFAIEAAMLAKQLGKPVQVLWSREDDIRFGQYRTASTHKMAAAIKDGQITAFTEQAAILSVATQQGMDNAFKDGVDTYYSDGPEFLYGIDNLTMQQRIGEQAVPVGWWRGVSATNYAFAYECWLDELAAKLKRDPRELRLALLAQTQAKFTEKPEQVALYDRVISVVKTATDAANWSQPTGKGRGRGLACYTFGGRSPVANVVDVSFDSQGKLRIDKITIAVDCGMAVNPDLVRAQFEGGALFGLSSVLHQEITQADGQTQQSNFHDFPVCRMPETPEFDIHILPSDRDPEGVGEPCVMAIAPAVLNAVYDLTGKRYRSLPLKHTDLI